MSPAASPATSDTLTVADLAERLRCSEFKIRKEARLLALGVNLGGRAGYRFTESDATALWESMRPEPPTPRRRRRRST